METFQFKYSFSELNIKFNDIENLLGYENGKALEPFPENIIEILDLAKTICSIEGGIAIYDSIGFNVKGEKIIINKVEFNLSKIIFPKLKNAEMIAVFVCTAGKKIEELSKTYFRTGEYPKGYIADVIGSAVVEAAVDNMMDDLKKMMALRTLFTTNSYSPGYCGWDVFEQQNLFGLLPYNFCNVSLSDSSLMDPIKSVSGIIGIGRNVKLSSYTCLICSQKDCIYRNKKPNKVL